MGYEPTAIDRSATHTVVSPRFVRPALVRSTSGLATSTGSGVAAHPSEVRDYWAQPQGPLPPVRLTFRRRTPPGPSACRERTRPRGRPAQAQALILGRRQPLRDVPLSSGQHPEFPVEAGRRQPKIRWRGSVATPPPGAVEAVRPPAGFEPKARCRSQFFTVPAPVESSRPQSRDHPLSRSTPPNRVAATGGLDGGGGGNRTRVQTPSGCLRSVTGYSRA